MKHSTSFLLSKPLKCSFLTLLSPSPSNCVSSLRTMTNQSSPNFIFLEFSVRFLAIEGFPSDGSMEIFINRTWKQLCIANWDNTEKTLVCQAQGYNGSTLKVDWQNGTNSVGNTNYSCEQLKQNCQEKTDPEIKCSGNKRSFGC